MRSWNEPSTRPALSAARWWSSSSASSPRTARRGIASGSEAALTRCDLPCWQRVLGLAPSY